MDAIAGGGDDSVRRPLVSRSEEILPYADPASPQRPPLDAGASQAEQQRKPQRVASLDVFRGFTVAVSGDSNRPPHESRQLVLSSDCVRR